MLCLRTVGRRTGEERIAILGYIEDGPNLVTKAMNGWADPAPAWWSHAPIDTSRDGPSGSAASRHGAMNLAFLSKKRYNAAESPRGLRALIRRPL